MHVQFVFLQSHNILSFGGEFLVFLSLQGTQGRLKTEFADVTASIPVLAQQQGGIKGLSWAAKCFFIIVHYKILFSKI